MFCRKCGNQIINGNVCGNCGFDQIKLQYASLTEPPKSRREKKKHMNIGLKIGMIIALFIVCIGVGIFGYMYFFGSIKEDRQCEKLLSLIDERQFEDAYEYYEDDVKKSQSKEFTDDFSEKMEKRYDDILDEYNDGKLDDKSMDILFSLLGNVSRENRGYIDFAVRYDSLFKSKEKYKTGVNLLQNEKYEEAISCFMEVITIDSNYDDSKEQLQKAIIGMINDTDDYSNAFEILDQYSGNFSRDEYDSMKQNISNAVVSAADEKVKQLLKNNKYTDAKDYLNSVIKSYPDIDTLKQKKASLEGDYISSIKLAAKEYFDAKDYGKAASTIKTALIQLDNENTELKELYVEYKSYTGLYIDEMVTLQNYGTMEAGEDVKDNTGKTHSHSFSFEGYVEYLLDCKYATFAGTIALPMVNKNTYNTYYYEIHGDEKLLYTSPVYDKGSLPVEFSVDVSGVKVMKVILYYSTGYDTGYGTTSRLMIYDGLLTRNIQ